MRVKIYEKKKVVGDKIKILIFCKKYLLAYKTRLIFYMACILILTIIDILSPIIIGYYFDIISKSVTRDFIYQFCLYIGTINIISMILKYCASIVYTEMQISMGYELNMELIRHMQKVPLFVLFSVDTISLNQRLSGDSYNLISFSLNMMENTTINVIRIIFTFFVMINQNFIITLFIFVFIGIYIIIYNLTKEKIYNMGLIFRESQELFVSKVYEQIKYIKLIKIDSLQKEMTKRMEISFKDFINIAIPSKKFYYLYTSLDKMISTIARVSLFLIGGLKIMEGTFTVGKFIIFNSYFDKILGSCRYFFNLGNSYQNAMSSYNRIQELLEYKKEHNGTRVIKKLII